MYPRNPLTENEPGRGQNGLNYQSDSQPVNSVRHTSPSHQNLVTRYHKEAMLAHHEAANLTSLTATIITKRRKQIKWSQSELARKAGLSRLTIVALERGDGNARLGTVQTVAAALSLNLTLTAAADHPDE